jgi:L,D-peptidoglycan transpeptidase YkuD (ErfK/YbiS/YcfS/YnhG family)
MRIKYPLTLMLSLLLLLLCTLSWAENNQDTCQILNHAKLLKKLHQKTSQIVVVKSLGGIKARITLCQKENTSWMPSSPAFAAIIGKNGIAASGTKIEGDLKTPAGIYRIGEVFGTQPLAVKMDFKYITKEDKFIDDTNHPLYNQWHSGPTNATSYENMQIEPYIYGAIVNYNMNPIVAGAGSAIFIHIWDSPTSPTAGCVALEKKSLIQMLQWLDKAQHPYIFIYEEGR